MLTKLQKKDAPLQKEDIGRIQDGLEMSLEIKCGTNGVMYLNLVTFTKREAKGRVTSNPIELSVETYRHMYQKGKNAIKKDTALKKAEVRRPARPTR